MGNADVVRTYFLKEEPGKNIGVVINESLELLDGLAEIIDIKFSSFSDEDGVGWHSALVIYKRSGK